MKVRCSYDKTKDPLAVSSPSYRLNGSCNDLTNMLVWVLCIRLSVHVRVYVYVYV